MRVYNLVPGKQGGLHWRPTAPRLLLLMSLSPIVVLGVGQSLAGGFSCYCSFHGGWGWKQATSKVSTRKSFLERATRAPLLPDLWRNCHV